MRFLRQLIRGSFCGGPLAAVIGILMALQALIGGFGTGAMAFAEADAMEICSAGGVVRHAAGSMDHAPGDQAADAHPGHDGHAAHSEHAGHDGMQMAHAPMAGMEMPVHAEGPGEGAHKNHRPDCCLTACQVAASVVHVGLHSTAPQPMAVTAGQDAPVFVAPEAIISPRQLGLGGDARGPPLFPI